MAIAGASEADIQRQCLQVLRMYGAVPIRVNSGAVAVAAAGGHKRRFVRMNSAPGCSDIIACFLGAFIAVEVKRPGGKLTESQRQFLAEVTAAGGVACVITSAADLAGMLQTLRAEHGG